MTETTTIRCQYWPSDSIICALINNGWTIDDISEHKDVREYWTITKAHKPEKEKSLESILYPSSMDLRRTESEWREAEEHKNDADIVHGDGIHTTHGFGCNRCGYQVCVCGE